MPERIRLNVQPDTKAAMVAPDKAPRTWTNSKRNPEWAAIGAALQAERERRGLSRHKAATLLRMLKDGIRRMEEGLADPATLVERWAEVRGREGISP